MTSNKSKSGSSAISKPVEYDENAGESSSVLHSQESVQSSNAGTQIKTRKVLAEVGPDRGHSQWEDEDEGSPQDEEPSQERSQQRVGGGGGGEPLQDLASILRKPPWLDNKVINLVNQHYQLEEYHQDYVYIAMSTNPRGPTWRFKIGMVTSENVAYQPIHSRDSKYHKCGMRIKWVLPVRKAKFVENLALMLLSKQFKRDKALGRGRVRYYGRSISCKCGGKHNDLFTHSDQDITWLKNLLENCREAENQKIKHQYAKDVGSSVKANNEPGWEFGGENSSASQTSLQSSDPEEQPPISESPPRHNRRGRKPVRTRGRTRTEPDLSSSSPHPSIKIRSRADQTGTGDSTPDLQPPPQKRKRVESPPVDTVSRNKGKAKEVGSSKHASGGKGTETGSSNTRTRTGDRLSSSNRQRGHRGE